MQTGNHGKGPLGALLPVVAAVLVAGTVVLGFLYVRAPRATRLHAGDVAPDFTLPPVGAGTPLRLSSVRGGPTFLFFFDSRRDGNEAYVDALQRLNKRYADRGLTVVGVALDPEAETARQFLVRVYVEFPILSDPFGSVLKPGYGSPRDPEAYLLDRQGRVVAAFTERVDANTSDFRKLLEKELPPVRGQ